MPVFIVVQLKWTNVIALFSCIASELSRIFVLVHISIWETDKSTSFKNWTRLLWGCIFHFQTFPISRRCILWIREMIFLSPGNKLRWLWGMLCLQIWDSWKIQNTQREKRVRCCSYFETNKMRILKKAPIVVENIWWIYEVENICQSLLCATPSTLHNLELWGPVGLSQIWSLMFYNFWHLKEFTAEYMFEFCK